MIKPKTQTRQFYACTFSDPSALKAGDFVDIQVIRTGKRNHKVYGPFEVTPEMLAEMIANFDANVRGVEIAVDENHEDDHKAMGRYRRLYSPTPDSLWATIELTQHGADLLSKGMYKYFSAEIIRKDIDEETGKEINNLLVGGGFTNRPFVKNMEPLQASEGSSDGDSFILCLPTKTMSKLTALLSEFKDKKNLNSLERSKLIMAYSEAMASDDKPTDEQAAEVETNLAKEDEVKNPDVDDDSAAQAQLSETNAKLSETQAQLAEVQKQLKLSELEKEFNSSFVLSESNPKGVFKPAQKDAFTKFALSLNDSQKKQFTDLVKGIDVSLNSMFGEVGHADGGSASLSEDQKYDKAVKAKMAKENISYAKASDTITTEEINAAQ